MSADALRVMPMVVVVEDWVSLTLLAEAEKARRWTAPTTDWET
jgi:hypothetical protein